MANIGTATLSISEELDKKLDALARATKRSKAALADEAISSYVEENVRHIEAVKQAVREADDPDSLWVGHDEAMDWFESLGTSTPLPKPKGRRKSEL
jgi:predicted transcriptional regulator